MVEKKVFAIPPKIMHFTPWVAKVFDLSLLRSVEKWDVF
jgi:hypothetical protein